jgi:DNA mismatch repair protein MSH5
MRTTNLKSDEDRELEIIHDLAEKVLPFAEAISEACDICAELDCLLCFAEASNLYNYRRPQMTEENVINIKQGRCVLVSYDRCSPKDTLILQAPIARTNCRHIRAK